MTALVFCHGINSGPVERAKMGPALVAHLQEFGVPPDTFSTIAIAEWRSLGSFMGDLVDLKEHPVRWMEAVSDVETEIHRTLLSAEKLLLVGHSMGQPILAAAVLALAHYAGNLGIHSMWERCEMITAGGPMGNPFARPYFDQMDQALWGDGIPGVERWDDVWNPEDPVCALAGRYEAFRAATPHKLDFPGHPGPFSPFAEHSSYFQAPAFYELIKAAAARLATDAKPV